MIVDEARSDGRVTVMSRQPVSVDEAVALVDTVLRQKGLAAIRNGRILRIVSVDQAKKDLIPVRMGNDPDKIEPTDRMVTQIIPIRYADAVKLKADLASLIPSTADVTSNASSNTLIITSTEATVRRVVEIIRAIDVHMSEVSQVKVFQLKYANAASAARLITEIFRQDQPGGQTATAPFGGVMRRFFGGGGGGAGGTGAAAAAGAGESGQRTTRVTASADDRTNTLVVSAAPDMMKVIEGVVKELDANPAEQQSFFVYRVRNGQAKNMETVLNNLFGWTGSAGVSAARQAQSTPMSNIFGTMFGGATTGGAGRGGTGGFAGRGLGSSGTSAFGTRTSTFTQGRTSPSGVAGARPSAGIATAASDLAGQVYIVADEDTNSLVVTTASKNFDRVKAIIMDLDRPVPQVLIKVLLAEVTHDNSVDLGVEFSGLNIRASGNGFRVGTDFGVATPPVTGPGGFSFTLEEKNVTAAIRAIASTAKLDVLSRPYILTADNQQAGIQVGSQVARVTTSRTTETGQTINTIEYYDIGIILNVTPHVNPQGIITMDVWPQITTLTGKTVPIQAGLDAPVYAKRAAISRLAIVDGQTAVIGGLMEDRITDSVDKVPFLGDIPVLGLLFQHKVTMKTKTELLIFLTPHLAKEPGELKEMTESELGGAKAVPDAVEKGAFQEHLKGMQRGAASRPSNEDKMIDVIPPPANENKNPDSSVPRGGDADNQDSQLNDGEVNDAGEAPAIQE
jgi:general secretion pathway protein D